MQPRRRERWILLAVVVASAVVFLDSTLVSVALPRIAEELGSGPFGVLEAQSYVYNGYLLTLSALLVLAGAMTDQRGRRRMFSIGLIGFGVTSVLCGLAPSMLSLVIFRLLQGASGALLVPGSLAIITVTFAGERRGWAFGVWAGASAAVTVLGPLVGGVLVDAVSWRLAFLVNAPLLALALWATLRCVPESRDEDAVSGFDWAGSALIVLALGGLTFGAIRGQERAWQDPAAFVALAVGVLAAGAFLPVEARARHPLLPLSLFGVRNFTVTNLSTLLIYGALYVTTYLATIHLQGTLGYSATAAGMALVPAPLLLALLSSRFGALSARHGPRRFMAAGPAIMAASVLWLARLPAGSATWSLMPGRPSSWVPPQDYVVDVLPAMVVFGLGLAVMVAPLTTALMSSVPERNSGVASAVNNAISRIGPQLVGALLFIGVTATFGAGLAARGVDPEAARGRLAPLNAPVEPVSAEEAAAARGASTEAFRVAMGLAALLLAAGATVNLVGIRDADLRLEPVSESLPTT